MKFTKKTRLAIISACLVVMLFTTVAVAAYDGTSDPLISLSYLQQFKSQQIDPLIESLQSKFTALEQRVNSLSSSGGTTADPVVNTGGGYAVVQLSQGQTLIGCESCEIILRSGTATVVLDAESKGGISDLTGGADLGAGESVTTNHLLLVARDDGRGLQITSDEAFLMVRGGYSIE